MFYKVANFKDHHGIDLLEVHKYLQPGRLIRWRSTGAEYGLIEATVTVSGTAGDSLKVISSEHGRTSELYIEQVAEVTLTQDEAEAEGFGYPT